MTSCSVIIPCYNGSRFLRATIDSLFAQSTSPQEIIFVDDGSTDDSATIAATFSPRVKVIRQANRGESAARNVGLRAATGDYVLFLDVDDLLAPEAIQHLERAVLRDPGTVAVMGLVSFTEAPDSPLDTHIPHFTSFFPQIVQTNFGPPHCWFTPRELALSVGGFRETLVNSEDWDFWGRIALTGARLVSVPYVGALYRRHPQSQVATTPKPAIFKGRLAVCETLAEGILARPALLETVGETLFWSLWAMLDQARRGGVPAKDLQHAEGLMRKVAARGPRTLRRSTFARVVRYVGARHAGRLRGWLTSVPSNLP
jgi:glycosyltransferase involved in cell wall biosynthesis